MHAYLSNWGATDKANKNYFHRTIWTPTENILNINNGNFGIQMMKIW